MDKNDVKLFVAIPNGKGTLEDHHNIAGHITTKFNSCFKSLGYQSNRYDVMSYKDNTFDDIRQAIGKIGWADVIIISNDLSSKRDDVLFNMIIDSGASYLFEGQLDTVAHCFNVVEDAFYRPAKNE